MKGNIMTNEKLIFVAPSRDLKQAAEEYKNEHLLYGEEELHGGALYGSMDFDMWITLTEENSSPDTVHSDWVVASTFFVVRESDGKIIGMADIRHYLNDFLSAFGGHIGYGVRPSERKKGYGKEILRMSLEYAKSIGIENAMLACYRDNKASGKIIINNGGRLDMSYGTDSKIVDVYYIKTTE